MDGRQVRRAGRGVAVVSAALAAWSLTSCGGGSTGNAQDSGPSKTYLSVQASVVGVAMFVCTLGGEMVVFPSTGSDTVVPE